jgi:hypothetical protein
MSEIIVCTKTELQEVMLACLYEYGNNNPSVPDQPVNKPNSEVIYGLEALSKLIGYSVPKCMEFINKGKIPFMRPGRKYIFNIQNVFNALKNHGINPKL